MSRLSAGASGMGSGSSTRASWPTTARRSSFGPCRAKKGDGDGLDPIERAVAFLFGKKALEDENPMGLKRLNFDTLPDQRVETQRQALPLPGDDDEVSMIRGPLLAGTQLEREPLERAYDTARGDAWSPSAFHGATRARGAALVLCETEAGSWCGGYNPLGFLGYGDEHATNGAFLFAWPGAGDPRRKGAPPPVKLPKIGGPALAVIDAPGEAVRFGAEGLSAAMRAPDARAARSRLGTYYERVPKPLSGGRRSVFLSPDEEGAGGRATLKRVAVYVARSVPEYRLDGIVWKSDAPPPPPPP